MKIRLSALFIALVGVLVCLVNLECSGNWSNEDIAYSTAFPRRLRMEALGSYATAPTGPGNNTLGQTSQAFVYTATAGSNYDALLDSLLSATDSAARQPDSRGDRSRTWGPISLIADSTFSYTITSSLVDGGGLEWSVSAKPASGSDGGDNFTVGMGTFTPDGSVVDGTGVAHFPVNTFPATFTKNASYFLQVTSVHLAYTFLGKTVTATTTLTLDAGIRTYRYRNLEDGSARFDFEAQTPEGKRFMRTGWTAAGAGVLARYAADDAGTNDFLGLDCWDADGKVIYHYGEPAPANGAPNDAGCAFPVPLKP